jgi:aquaporin Z
MSNATDFKGSLENPKALAAEAIGTFFLVLAAAGAGSASGIIGGGGNGAWAAGLTLAILVFMFGPVSGAHFNPAISLGMMISGRLAKNRLAPYIGAQLLGALTAGLLLRVTLDSRVLGLTNTALPGLSALVIEMLLTFTLQWVILSVTEKDVPLLMTGLSIGLILTACGLWAGHLSGASLNPARTLGPAIAAWDFSNVWIYLVGPPLGAALAANAYAKYKSLN